MNKKGDLIDNVLGIILAAICIGLLVLLVVTIYRVIVTSEYKNAERILEKIIEKTNALQPGEKSSILIQSPCKDANDCRWFIAGFGVNDINRPDRCYFSSCICLCGGKSTSIIRYLDNPLNPPKFIEYDIERAREICQDPKTGICRNIGIANLSILKNIYSKSGNNFVLSDSVKQFYIVKIDSPLKELYISREQNELNISTNVYLSQ